MRAALGLIGLVGGLVLVATACATGTVMIEDDDDDGGSGGGAGGSGSTGSMTKSTGTKGSDCGNGVIDGGETCDGTNLNGRTCESLEFAGGTLSCDGACKLDTSACIATQCDNGTIEEGEECDGTDLGSETCVSSGFAGGQLECSPDTCLIDTSNCKEALAEDFEGGALPAGWSTTSWTVSSGITHAGTYAFRSGFISDYGLTTATVTVQADTPGSISFYHQESTESGYDYLQFYINGVMQAQWSGLTAWQLATYPLSVGTNQLEWRYTKDGSLSAGSDAVFVDDITAMNAYIP